MMKNEKINDEIEIISSDDNKNKKGKRSHNFWQIFKSIPKVFKYAMIVLLLVILLFLGKMFGIVFNSSSKVIEFGFENVGELVTQTSHVTEVSDTKVNRDFFKLFDIPFTESRQIFSVRVDVDASVNFDNISYKQNNDNKSIIVNIPHARIYKATLIDESLKIYLDDESLFSRIDLKTHNEAREKLKEQAVETSKNEGILDAADKNAQILIERFIKSNKEDKDYKVFFNYVGE